MSGYLGVEPTIAVAGYADWIPLQTVTASLDSAIGFSGISTDFDEYRWDFINIHPQTDAAQLLFQVNAAGATGFNESITSTAVRAYQQEDDSGGAVDYRAGEDQANGTAYEIVMEGIDNANDMGGSGSLTIYDPASGTFMKHFVLESNTTLTAGTKHQLQAGYINITTAIVEVNFKMSSGYIETGTITMFGLGK